MNLLLTLVLSAFAVFGSIAFMLSQFKGMIGMISSKASNNTLSIGPGDDKKRRDYEGRIKPGPIDNIRSK